jgi:hypothetical protein
MKQPSGFLDYLKNNSIAGGTFNLIDNNNYKITFTLTQSNR